MTSQEAIKIIEDFAEATRILKVDAAAADYNKKSVAILREKVKKLENEARKDRSLQRNLNMLEKSSGFEVCKQCNGDGGAYIDMGEAGGEGIDCDLCNGSGIIKILAS